MLVIVALKQRPRYQDGKRLTPSRKRCYIGIDATDDGFVGRYEEQSGLARPDDLHTVVEHAATKTDQDEHVVPAVVISIPIFADGANDDSRLTLSTVGRVEEGTEGTSG